MAPKWQLRQEKLDAERRGSTLGKPLAQCKALSRGTRRPPVQKKNEDMKEEAVTTVVK